MLKVELYLGHVNKEFCILLASLPLSASLQCEIFRILSASVSVHVSFSVSLSVNTPLHRGNVPKEELTV